MTDYPNLTIERFFDAPRHLVWKAWTDKDLLQEWWGPFGFTNPKCEIDPRPGGKIDIVMVAGKELGELSGMHAPMIGVFKEVIPQAKLVFTAQAIDNEDGSMILENINTVTFEEMGEKTKITVHVQVIKTSAKSAGPLSGMKIGWEQSLEKLTQLVKKYQ